jgi:transposase
MARQKPSDRKIESLKSRGCLHPHPERVKDPLFEQEGFFDPRDSVQVKYEMVRRARVDGVAVTACAATFGFSRPSFYQAQVALQRAGIQGLVPAKPGPRSAHKLSEEIVAHLEEHRSQSPDVTAADLAQLVQQRFGKKVHPRSVERALARRGKKR